MDQTTTGASLVSGIQDISAFLPIIGTEQCEKHVGEALQKGFLYAAATPLSMFGSLGIVKASAAILVASISPRFAQMLADAGFRLEGSVAAMIGATPQKNSQRCTSKDAKVKTNNSRRKRNSDEEDDIPQHLASRKFQELLDEQHINKSQLTLVFDYYSWNWQLCISTGLLACLSITPYIPLILDDHHSSRSFPAWAFPLMRIVGSAVSVVIAQMIMQVQMQRILQLTSDEAAQPITSKTPLRDAEKGPVADASHQNCSKRGDKMNEALPLPIVFSRPHLIFLQVLIFIGMVSTTVGYLGCFTVVQTARPNHTYIWLGVEIALALLRILIWGHNPHWDEPEGITLELSLPADVQKAPTITTSQDYMRYILGVGAGSENGRRDPFVILPDSRFLEYISPYTGPVEQFNDPDNRVAIYYTLAASSYADKALLTTVLDLESRSTFVLIHHCPFQEPSDCDSNDGLDVYSGTIEIMPDSGIMTAKCGNREYKFRERFDVIAEHSQEIANRIGGIDRVSRLRVSWTLELIDFPKPELDEPVNHSAQLSQSALTNLDKEYLRLQRLAYLWRRDFDQERQLHTLECMSSALDFDLPIERYAETLRSFANALEDLLNYECAFFEKHLMAKTMPVDAVDHIFNQYARRLEVRVTGEARKEARAQRFEK
ncbi:hypothetical protein DFH09DRAFT_81646 [Mycena vulgaris]|nr:hypothetical protein DFH09DRAFT_81646 [Mycena vulgaris]